MAMENKEDLGRSETEFKNTLFASNPELYLELYERPDSPLAKEEDKPEWFVPQSDEEVNEVLEQLKELGLA